MERKWLSRREPSRRDGGGHGDDAADYGGVGVDVAGAGDGLPEGFGVVVDVAGGQPEAEGDSVGGGEARAVADGADHRAGVVGERDVGGDGDLGAGLAVGGVGEDDFEEV